jgi:phosphoribosylformylglycinamidine synthase
MRTAVVVFPGSNSDYEAFHVVHHILGQPAERIWHKETSLEGFDVVILPGGFAHGDYLRAGAIARFSPIMAAVEKHAARGGVVLGICNGFQVLTEAGLLPGALMRNKDISFISRDAWVRVENEKTRLTMACRAGEVLRIPVAHGEGRYVAEPALLDRLEKERRVLFRYCGPNGEIEDRFNINGSERAIAGIMNEQGNVFGLMPHPERDAELIVGLGQGKALFVSLLESFRRAAA